MKKIFAISLSLFLIFGCKDKDKGEPLVDSNSILTMTNVVQLDTRRFSGTLTLVNKLEEPICFSEHWLNFPIVTLDQPSVGASAIANDDWVNITPSSSTNQSTVLIEIQAGEEMRGQFVVDYSGVEFLQIIGGNDQPLVLGEYILAAGFSVFYCNELSDRTKLPLDGRGLSWTNYRGDHFSIEATSMSEYSVY